MLTGNQVVGRIIPLDGAAQPGVLTGTVHRLYSGRESTTVRRQGRWALGPLGALDVPLPRGARTAASRAARGNEAVLGLAHGSRLSHPPRPFAPGTTAITFKRACP